MFTKDKMKVVILCGGRGTRLKEETEYRPKPMVTIGGKPILWHIMKIYAHYGFKDFILSLGYKGEMIKEYFLNYEAMNNDFTVCLGKHNTIKCHTGHKEVDWNVTLVDTGESAGTGGRIKGVEAYIDTDTFMATYGDGVSNVNISELVAFHKAHGKIGTMTGVHPASRFGEVKTSANGQIQHFHEKPQVGEGLINGGFFVFERKFLEYLSNGDCILEGEPMRELTQDAELMAYRHDGFWQCVDTYRELELLNSMWKESNSPWKVW